MTVGRFASCIPVPTPDNLSVLLSLYVIHIITKGHGYRFICFRATDDIVSRIITCWPQLMYPLILYFMRLCLVVQDLLPVLALLYIRINYLNDTTNLWQSQYKNGWHLAGAAIFFLKCFICIINYLWSLFLVKCYLYKIKFMFEQNIMSLIWDTCMFKYCIVWFATIWKDFIRNIAESRQYRTKNGIRK